MRSHGRMSIEGSELAIGSSWAISGWHIPAIWMDRSCTSYVLRFTPGSTCGRSS
ncbi:unnamed protein product [Symbiodinium sp. CCMP2592]|nr:unnamed protein product [Symbiodinium sp. CCMP2592]